MFCKNAFYMFKISIRLSTIADTKQERFYVYHTFVCEISDIEFTSTIKLFCTVYSLPKQKNQSFILLMC